MKIFYPAVTASIVMTALSTSAAHACSKGFIGMIAQGTGLMTEKHRCEAEKRHKEIGKPLDVILEVTVIYGAATVGGPIVAGAAAGAIESYKGASAEKALGKAVGYTIGGSIAKGFIEP